jgi:regulator of sigma E protease
MSVLIGLLGIAFIFGVAVTVHEFGHFAFAKLFGVRVERFSVGMGKVLWSRQWGDTEYALSALPIGGYVKLAGPMSKELEAEAELLDARDKTVDLERVLRERENPKSRRSRGFFLWLLAAGGLGVAGLLFDNPYAPVTMALVGLCLAGWTIAERAGYHREVDAVNVEELKADLAKAKEAAAKMEAERKGATSAAEAAIPGVSQVTAEEERLASSLLEDNIALRNKPFHAKFLIFVAGCAMNVLLAYSVLVGMLWVGVTTGTPASVRLEAANPDEPLAAYDIRDGDRVVSVNGEKVATWTAFEDAVIAAYAMRSAVALDIERTDAAGDATRVSVTIPWTEPDAYSAEPPADMPKARADAYYMGPAYLPFTTSAVAYDPPISVSHVVLNSAAEKAGILVGDKITAIDGRPVFSWRDFTATIGASAGKQLTLAVERAGADGNTERLNIIVAPDETEGKGRVGIVRGYNAVESSALPFGDALSSAGYGVWARSAAYLENLWKLVTGQVEQPLKQLGGALTISHLASKAANDGLQDFLNLFVMLNLILAIMNLLPIPLLDGGHILFSAIESIKGSPISARTLLWVYNASFYFIVLLAVGLIGNDAYQNSWRYFGLVEKAFNLPYNIGS